MTTNGEGAGTPDAAQPTTTGALTATLRRWLERHPVAYIGALEHTGRILPWPAAVALGPGHRLEERSLRDLVIDTDRQVLTSAFLTAIDRGVAAATVHLLDAPAEPVAVNYFDLRPELGIIVRVCWHDGAAAGEDEVLHRPPTGRPRLAMVTKGVYGDFVAVDDDFTKLLGWYPDEVVGRRSLEIIHPDDQSRAVDNWLRMMGEGGRHSVRLRHLHRDGSWVWLETCNDRVAGTGGEELVSCQLIDISQEMEAVDALRHQEELLRRVTEAVPVGLAHVAVDGSVTYANTQLQRLLEVPAIDHRSDLLSALDRDTVGAALDRVLVSGVDAEVEVTLDETLTRPAQRCRCTLSAVRSEGAVTGVLLCVVDVTELATLARHDPLTGLLNRGSITAALEEALARRGHLVGLVFADVDGLKQVNDEGGHAAGDDVLRRVADALRRSVRAGDHLGRLGGDEFLAVCPDVASLAHLENLAARIEEELAVDGLSASLGMELAIAGATDAATAVNDADQAMYEAKRARRAAGLA